MDELITINKKSIVPKRRTRVTQRNSFTKTVDLTQTNNFESFLKTAGSNGPFNMEDSNPDIPTVANNHKVKIVSNSRLNEASSKSKSPELTGNQFYNQLESKLNIQNPSIIDIQNQTSS